MSTERQKQLKRARRQQRVARRNQEEHDLYLARVLKRGMDNWKMFLHGDKRTPEEA